MRTRLAFAVLLLMAVPGSARASTGSISGRVTDVSGAPIHTICVDARSSLRASFIDPALDPRASAVTAADGTYTIAGLLPGPYTVHFHECWGGGPLDVGGAPPARHETEMYAQHWYAGADRADAATPVLVTVGETRGIDARLRLHPGIAGRATDTDGEPAGGVVVAAVTLDGSGWKTTTTAPDGRYKLLMGPEDAHGWKISFMGSVEHPAWGEYRQEWFDDAATFEDAMVVHYPAGEILVGLDATLERTGTMKGAVTNTRGDPVEACAEVYDASGAPVAWMSVAGPFTIGGLPTGSYKLSIVDCSLYGYESAWYGGGTTFADAAWIDVIWGEVTGDIDVTLRDGGAIAGHVRDASGNGLEGWTVLAEDTEGRYSWAALTEADGSYRLGTLIPSTALVSFSPPGGDAPVEWWDDAATRDAATPVHVLAETETTGIDATV